MIIDCISDLHGAYPHLEGGDLLIVGGDLTSRDSVQEHLEFAIWLANQDYKKIILIAGNHDNHLKRWLPMKIDNLDYLCDSGCEFEGLKIWGSPWTKTFPNMNPHCKAFTVETDEEIAEKWALFPDDIDILITHSPLHGILDQLKRYNGMFWHKEDGYESCGSVSLRNMVLDGNKFKKLKLHVFGHIHECGGHSLKLPLIEFVNASIMNEHYEPINKPVRVIL
jgi:Icc-related predicted phosphoesterase